MISTAKFNTDKLAEASSAESLVATDLAEWLVERGMPFREAHAVVGKVVRDALADGTPLVQVVASHPQLGNEAASLFDPGVSVGRRRSPGAAGPAASSEQSEKLAAAVRAARQTLS